MRPAEAEKLLGGYATGTLTEEERQHLFASALNHQEIFDALMDEEALRELLADPAVKAQLILALAHSAPPNVVPFWRRTGVIGAAASLLVAATAGLVYLRSPDQTPPPLPQETEKAPAAKALEVPAPAQVPGAPAPKLEPPEKQKEISAPLQLMETAAPTPPPPPPAMNAAAPMKAQDELRRSEVQSMAKKAEAPRTSAAAQAVVEVMANPKDAASERKKAAQEREAGGVPGGVPGGVIGGVVGGVVSGVVGGVVGGTARPAPVASAAKAKAEGQNVALADKGSLMPTWNLETRPDGAHVNVLARRDAHVVLLKRGSGGVVVVKLQPQLASVGETLPWLGDVRLVAGDLLDLYVLNQPVADPAKLPGSGPVDGVRIRIHPAAK